jgi:hypothetical protein
MPEGTGTSMGTCLQGIALLAFKGAFLAICIVFWKKENFDYK